MSTTRVPWAVLALLAAAPASFAQPSTKPAVPTYRLSEAHTHDNLSIFFLHGTDPIPNRKFLTLEEALKAGKVTVHETKNVQELAIENVSNDDVFVQAGDIVKGGKQDRTLALDAIVPARSGRIPIDSYCVEQNRWSQRGNEDATAFNASAYALANKDLKLAARAGRSQGGVWREVERTQQRLASVLKAEVRDPKSLSSLQLTLEQKKVRDAVDAYVKKLQPALSPKLTDVVGYAVVINGKVVSADVYANADLFRKLWPKLVYVSAVEALGERKNVKFAPIKPEMVRGWLAAAAKGKRTERAASGKQLEVQLENRLNVLFQTQSEKGKVIRQSYIAK